MSVFIYLYVISLPLDKLSKEEYVYFICCQIPNKVWRWDIVEHIFAEEMNEDCELTNIGEERDNFSVAHVTEGKSRGIPWGLVFGLTETDVPLY